MQTIISKLVLNNFRNFSSNKFEFKAHQVLLCGANGVGKTNCLEALSIMGRSPSLRGDEYDEMLKNDAQNFSIYSELKNHNFLEKIAVKFDRNSKKKTYEFNGEPSNSRRQSDLKNYLINFIILTPQIEQLFILGKSQRREYLDKIVCDIDLSHQNRLNDYQKLLKERLLILQKYRNQAQGEKWLDIIENNIAEIGISIAFARIEAIDFFNKAIASFSSNFPKTFLAVKGEVENGVASKSSLFLEDFYRAKLKANRQNDLENFKTEFGIHRADFDAIFCDKNLSATQSSTGEQKAIMISISLARAKISASYKNQPTILIFDEVVSHLDNQRKIHLFDEILQTNLQSFFSATSRDLIPKQKLQDLEVIEF
jgi:DNA replication and repair protein RecF